MDWHELSKTKVDVLREMAKEKADVEATTALNKEQLIEVLAEAMGIERPHLVVEGIDKAKIKKKIRALKGDVAKAIEAKDRVMIKEKRREIHRLKRQIKKAAHLTQ